MSAPQTTWDLTHPIHTGMQVYPGDPPVRLTPASSIARDQVAVTALACGTHTGTHLDAPSHVVPGGRTVDALTPGELCDEAIVLPVSTPKPRQAIGPEAIQGLPATVPPIVLVATGSDTHYGTSAYLDHPWLSIDLAAELRRRGMRVLGVDTLSPDRPGDLAVHRLVLGADGVIVENLRGLTELPRRVHVSLLPLPFAGADGSPVRAVAWG